jgi:hypothetical protein
MIGTLPEAIVFDNLLGELKRLEQINSISIALQKDADGYYDKECPAKNCLFGFICPQVQSRSEGPPW